MAPDKASCELLELHSKDAPNCGLSFEHCSSVGLKVCPVKIQVKQKYKSVVTLPLHPFTFSSPTDLHLVIGQSSLLHSDSSENLELLVISRATLAVVSIHSLINLLSHILYILNERHPGSSSLTQRFARCGGPPFQLSLHFHRPHQAKYLSALCNHTKCCLHAITSDDEISCLTTPNFNVSPIKQRHLIRFLQPHPLLCSAIISWETQDYQTGRLLKIRGGKDWKKRIICPPLTKEFRKRTSSYMLTTYTHITAFHHTIPITHQPRSLIFSLSIKLLHTA
ncbi:UNVERIFIED_CONTAM: hypothetical protein Slati_2335100 [Sesamum latifolium]|uniref:Uncharacterized protein n=1 Tax=Sesamum latifolium TaxID=2727402 RepID=A0AAW2WEZ0_9LAMI